MKQSAAELLGSDGPFARQSDHFEPRASQQEMAQAIADAIEATDSLIAESGTGTGKTYAYLVPVLTAGKRALISTGTKHLQEQLFLRDIPRVMETLALSAKVALLKGRSNYLCLQRLQQYRLSSRRLDKRQQNEIEEVLSWLPRTKRGDIAEITAISEVSTIWPQITSTADNCLGQECSYFEDCFVNQARKVAASSDLVVINHHLFFADKSLKEDGFGALLPEADTIVFDEAHQLPDIASNFLGSSFSSWQVIELCSDTRASELKEKSSISALLPLVSELEKQISDYRLSFGLNERRLAWQDAKFEIPALVAKLQALAKTLSDLTDCLAEAAVKGEALARCYERGLDLASACQSLADDQLNTDSVRWVELSAKHFRIHDTPLDVGRELQRIFAGGAKTNIFTSATLSINGDFSHFARSIGLPDSIETRCWDSPFDYFEQAVLYVPEGLPEPREADYQARFFDVTLPILRASSGGVFVLFTSFAHMQAYAARVEENSDRDEFLLLMQGDQPKRELLTEFCNHENSVLLGTMSFWEGVDVPGNALRCVIIDKLPFESPFDPVIKARLQAIEESGDNPFMQHQVPRAVITLRQGAGRLIRSVSDRGVLMICDARLRRTHYGRVFLDALPRMRRTSDETKVCGFLSSLGNRS